MICVKDEPSATESPRPNSSQPVGHYDPLDLDTEDLFVKYKVPNEFLFSFDFTDCYLICILLFLNRYLTFQPFKQVTVAAGEGRG